MENGKDYSGVWGGGNENRESCNKYGNENNGIKTEIEFSVGSKYIYKQKKNKKRNEGHYNFKYGVW